MPYGGKLLLGFWILPPVNLVDLQRLKDRKNGSLKMVLERRM